jgi:glycosyltransferase involved in cell wall biosynthesis
MTARMTSVDTGVAVRRLAGVAGDAVAGDAGARTRGETGAARDMQVRHYCPGGREHGGGIGRLIGYIVDAAGTEGDVHGICDTRGPRWSAPASAVHLLAAMHAMARDRIAAPRLIHHIHVAGRGSTARKLILTATARMLGCVHVLHLHDYDYARDFARRPRWLQRKIRRMFRGADSLIVLGERDRRTAEQLLGVAPDRIMVAHNCVPDPGEHAARAGEAPMLLFLGRLSERKGVPELLEALASPAMAGLPWRAVLAGDGPLDEYRKVVEARGLAGRVSMPGWLGEAEVSALCAQADILLLPSHSEGMAMAVIEGLAHGLAVVTTRVGAHEEAITDGVSGLFVPVGDPRALAATLARLVRDPAERARLSGGARAAYLARFAIDRYVARLAGFYRGLTEHRAVPAAQRKA